MTVKCKLASAIAAASLLAAGAANAALLNGFSDGSNNTSVFISVVERNTANLVVRNLVIDTGARTLDTFAGTPWSTTAAQETQILAFLASKGAGHQVSFNVGGGLNDQSFATDLQGFLTSGNAAGPAADGYAQLATAITSVDTFIGDTASGTFNAANVLAANASIDPGWHDAGWGNSMGGGIETSNEILFGASSQIVGWKTRAEDFAIVRSILGPLTSNVATGDISFAAVPLPGVAWLLAPAMGLVAPWVKRRKTGN